MSANAVRGIQAAERARGSLLSLACCLRNRELNFACRISTSNWGQRDFQTSAGLPYDKCCLPDLLVWCQGENLQSWLSESSGWQSEQTEWAGPERDCKTINTEHSQCSYLHTISLWRKKKQQNQHTFKSVNNGFIRRQDFLWEVPRSVKHMVNNLLCQASSSTCWEMQNTTGSMKAEGMFNNQRCIGIFPPVSAGPSIKSQCSWSHLVF